MSWLLIANQVKAQIYQLDKKCHLRPISQLSNPLGRERNKALRYGKPGMNRSKFKGSTSHAMTGEKDPHDDVKEQFAKQIAEYLHKQFLVKNFLKINIVAEPKMLGKIRHHVETFLTDQVEWTTKDLGKVPQIRWPEILGYSRPA
jgi:hypothetical protein